MKQGEKKLSIWKGIACLFTFAFLILTCSQVQGATAANYVIAREKAQATSNGYSVKVYQNSVYVKKGTGSWKKIAYGNSKNFVSPGVTTDGKTIYYALNNINGKSNIYSVSMTGTNRRLVKSYSKNYINEIYRYGNDLYFSSTNVYRYSLTRKTTTTIAKNAYMGNALYGYVAIAPMMGKDMKPAPLRVYHAPTGKMRTITYNSVPYAVFFKGSKVYYVECPTYSADKKNFVMQVKSCNLNGADKKTHNAKLYAWAVLGVTDQYIEFYRSNNVAYRYTYSTRKLQLMP